MNAKVNASEFLTAMNKVNKVTKGKQSLQILENIKVEFTDNKCILTGTNLDQYIVTEIEAQGDNFGFVFMDTKSIIKASKYFDNELSFEFEDNTITLNSNGKSCKQITFTIDEYPETINVKADNIYNVKSDSILNRYDKIKYAVSKDEARAILTGVCFREDRMIALDGFRMALNTNNSLMVDKEFTAPQKAMDLLSIYNKNADLEMQVNNKYLLFTDGETKVISRLFEGEFVDVNKIISNNAEEQYSVNVKQYINELKYLNEFLSNQPYVKFEKGVLTAKNVNGEYKSTVDFGEESKIVYGFNCDYMLDALKQFNGDDNVEYKITSPLAPITLESGDNLAMVLPVRLKSA